MFVRFSYFVEPISTELLASLLSFHWMNNDTSFPHSFRHTRNSSQQWQNLNWNRIAHNLLREFLPSKNNKSALCWHRIVSQRVRCRRLIACPKGVCGVQWSPEWSVFIGCRIRFATAIRHRTRRRHPAAVAGCHTA